MEAVLLVLFFFFSSSLCAGDQSHLGTGSSLAVCQPDTCALISGLAALREKLGCMVLTQSTLEQSLGAMVQKMATAEAKLQTCETQAEELKKLNQAQGEQLNALKESMAVAQTRVAFSAALGTSAGPFTEDTPLKYQRILSNIGSGYNPATGTFTAMVRGMYYFSFTMYNNNVGQSNSVVSLMMNSQRLVSTWDTEGSGENDSATNGAAVQLEAGASVFVKLYAKRAVYDDNNYYNTFSGFLLFTL